MGYDHRSYLESRYNDQCLGKSDLIRSSLIYLWNIHAIWYRLARIIRMMDTRGKLNILPTDFCVRKLSKKMSNTVKTRPLVPSRFVLEKADAAPSGMMLSN